MGYCTGYCILLQHRNTERQATTSTGAAAKPRSTAEQHAYLRGDEPRGAGGVLELVMLLHYVVAAQVQRAEDNHTCRVDGEAYSVSMG
jgi:hypothetical protein